MLATINTAVGLLRDGEAVPASVDAAKAALSQIPDGMPAPELGIDDDGCLYFVFTWPTRRVYWTFGDGCQHLLIKRDGGENTYLDDRPCAHGETPLEIMAALATEAATPPQETKE